MIQIFNRTSSFLLWVPLFIFLIGHIFGEPPMHHLNSFFLFNVLLCTATRKDYSHFTPRKARLPLTTRSAKIQGNLTTKALPGARGRILTASSRMPGTGVDLLKGNSAFDKISEQFMSLYPCSFSFLLCRYVN